MCLAVCGVLEVYTLLAIVEHVAQLGICVNQIKKLQTLFRILCIDRNHIQRTAHGLVGKNRVAYLLNNNVLTHLRTP